MPYGTCTLLLMQSVPSEELLSIYKATQHIGTHVQGFLQHLLSLNITISSKSNYAATCYIVTAIQSLQCLMLSLHQQLKTA